MAAPTEPPAAEPTELPTDAPMVDPNELPVEHATDAPSTRTDRETPEVAAAEVTATVTPSVAHPSCWISSRFAVTGDYEEMDCDSYYPGETVTIF
jgi:hypothetical protein